MSPNDTIGMADARPDTGTSLIDAVADWLMTQALGDAEMEDLIDGCCNRLHAAGIPILRAQIAYRTLHPLFTAVSLTWHPGKGVETARFADEIGSGMQESPYLHMMRTGVPYLRRHLAGPEAVLDYPILSEIRDAGATDYLAYRVGFGGALSDQGIQDGLVGSWATDRATGFSDSDIRSLLRIQRRLGVACKITIKSQIARNVVTTYLGPDAGDQVLHGQIKRGDGQTIHAVLWLSDLRNSTRMADEMTAVEFLRVLNGYFECTAGAVLAHGGEVLLFIGDAVLAMFPIRDGAATAKAACEAALAAARDAESRLTEVNLERVGADKKPLGFGIGLHIGNVVYGNIGVQERLQFTVVGAAANEVARLEDLTKELDRRLVVSAAFAANLPMAWESLGNHQLRGVGQRHEVFAAPAA